MREVVIIPVDLSVELLKLVKDKKITFSRARELFREMIAEYYTFKIENYVIISKHNDLGSMVETIMGGNKFN